MGRTLCHEHLLTASETVRFQYPHLHDADKEFARAVEQVRGAMSPRRAHDRRPRLHGPRARRALRLTRRRGDRRSARDVHRASTASTTRSSPITSRRATRTTSRTRSSTTSRSGSRAPRSRRRSSRRPRTSRASRRTSRRCTARPRARACGPARRSWPTRARRAAPGSSRCGSSLEEGVAPEKVMIAHTGDTDDLDHIEELLALGPLHRHGPLRDRRSSCPTSSATRRSPSSAAAATRAHGALAGRLRDDRLVPRGDGRPARAELELHLHLRDDHRPAARRSAWATRTSTRCSTTSRGAGWQATDERTRPRRTAGPRPGSLVRGNPRRQAPGVTVTLPIGEARREQRHPERGVELRRRPALASSASAVILPSATATSLRSSRRRRSPPMRANTRTFLLEESRMRRSLAVTRDGVLGERDAAAVVDVAAELLLLALREVHAALGDREREGRARSPSPARRA